MILIVDDDRSVTASVGLLLKQAGYATHAAGSPGEALAWLEGRSCDLVIQDMNFSRETSGEEGLALLARIKAVRPTLPVVLLTAWGSIDLAVRGIKAGAADFVTKPWSNPQLLQTVQTALGLAAAPGRGDAEPPPTREELDDRADFGELVGEDPQLLRVLETVARVAPTDASVLVIGESGTGKELIAEALHRNGGPAPRAVREGQPGRHLRLAVRERDVRPRARRLHRRASRSARAGSRPPTAGRSSSTRSATSTAHRR